MVLNNMVLNNMVFSSIDLSNHTFTERSLKGIGFDHVRRYDKALIIKDDFNDNPYNH